MEPLITDIPNSGHLPNNGQESVHQPYFPLLYYKTNLARADSFLLRTMDNCACINKQQSIQFNKQWAESHINHAHKQINNTVDPQLSGSNGTDPNPDNWNIRICETKLRNWNCTPSCSRIGCSSCREHKALSNFVSVLCPLQLKYQFQAIASLTWLSPNELRSRIASFVSKDRATC